MSRKKTQKNITTIAVVVATILAWLSGFFVMQIVYDSITASIIFGTVWAVIVFCESRFSQISLKSDGKVEITKEEIKSNMWQIVAATLVAFLVTLPIEMKLFAMDIAVLKPMSVHDLGLQIFALGELFPVKWLPMSLICLGVIVVFQIPIFIKMAEED
ncbi:MAG: DUF4407 domain-containing protein [Bacteroidales bacterium]|nr:DUF4407 domain-containing protein [Bacteroidales bacterium]